MSNKQPDKSVGEQLTDGLRDFSDILAAPEGSLVIYKAGPVVRHGLIDRVNDEGVWLGSGRARPVELKDILRVIYKPAEFVLAVELGDTKLARAMVERGW